jgi:gamma-glutamylaminecyclotransferase
VYGTLKRRNSIRGLDKVANAKFIGEANTINKSFIMMDLGLFPGVAITTASNPEALKIGGEVFEVTDAVLSKLDKIEGYPDFYNRTKVNTTLGTAWMYYLQNPTDFTIEQYEDQAVSIVDGIAYWIG